MCCWADMTRCAIFWQFYCKVMAEWPWRYMSKSKVIILTLLLMLVIISARYGRNPSRTVGVKERTWNAGQTSSENLFLPVVRSDLNGSLLTCLYFIMYQEYDVICIFSCDQAALWMVQSVRPPHLFHYVPIIISSWKWCPCKRSRSEVKVQGHRGQNLT